MIIVQFVALAIRHHHRRRHHHHQSSSSSLVVCIIESIRSHAVWFLAPIVRRARVRCPGRARTTKQLVGVGSFVAISKQAGDNCWIPRMVKACDYRRPAWKLCSRFGIKYPRRFPTDTDALNQRKLSMALHKCMALHFYSNFCLHVYPCNPKRSPRFAYITQSRLPRSSRFAFLFLHGK